MRNPITQLGQSVLAHCSVWFIGTLAFAAGPKASAMMDLAELDRPVDAVTPRVVEWRRDTRQYPERSNRCSRWARHG
jgi:hypothetical protein